MTTKPLPEGEGLPVRRTLADAARQLAPVSDTPRLDAELLMAHALGTSRERLLLHHLGDPAPPELAPLLGRRLAGEPIAYITGTRDFWTVRLAVTPAVLIPRADSETLMEVAVRHFGARVPERIVDLGTGSGALLLAALDQWPRATGIGVDVSAAALEVADGNARRLGLSERARFRLGDWAAGIDERFDLVLCNPPYVADAANLPREVGHEPPSALFAGADGLDCYRVLAPQVPRLIAPGGIACIEIGADGGAAVRDLFADAGRAIRIDPDLAGRDRCLSLPCEKTLGLA